MNGKKNNSWIKKIQEIKNAEDNWNTYQYTVFSYVFKHV